VEIGPDKATYTVVSGESLTIRHHGSALTVNGDGPVVRALPPQKPRPAPEQPPHRGPSAR
jgi:alpha,alpha-trehalose phosphorylase